jgi:hypothetical protein
MTFREVLVTDLFQFINLNICIEIFIYSEWHIPQIFKKRKSVFEL